MSSDSVVLVGLDVHKDSIVVAYSVGFGDVENLGKISPRATDIDRLCKRMQSKASQVMFVYEAGPCGYGLHRPLTGKGHQCMVCAAPQARTRSRHASSSMVGTCTGDRSPARSDRTSLAASRRSVLTRSPGFLGISDGAQTMHWWPLPVSCRCSP